MSRRGPHARRSAVRVAALALATAAGIATLLPLPAQAQAQAQAPGDATPTVLDPVVVSTQRTRESAFDSPAAISAVTRETIENAGPQVNLSESLARVPGISILNRQNYAQDLQLSIRGFGARSTFGVRGVRLIVDGIPATMPDGQGQTSSIDLGSAGRIEVLRGPLAQLYGNAAGGVVQVFTEDDALQPTTTLGAAAGPYGLWRVGSKFSTTTASGYGMTLDASWFQTDGWRDHSAAERGQFNGRWQKDVTRDLHSTLVVNVLDQPMSQDPGGLTRAQWQANPRQVAITVTQQDARKTVHQKQIGNVDEWRIDDDTTATARFYVGERDLYNALSTPLAAQLPVTSSGGIVQFTRVYGGAGLVVTRRFRLDADRSLRLTGGVEADRMRENRQGYIDNGGFQGALKRDERNTVVDTDVFAQAAWDFAPAWTLTAGARRSSVRFHSEDHFIIAPSPGNPGNPDDSGSVDYGATNPVLGIAWRARPDLNFYANIGRGFETPTFTELAYKPVGTGLNTDLVASRSRHAEVGVKWKPSAGQRVEAALFDIATNNELVVDTNNGGRSTFTNAGRTKRRGAELFYIGQLGDEWRLTLSFTRLDARFVDPFTSGSGAAAVSVAAGNYLPGTPGRNAFAELAWAPRQAWGGFNAAVEVLHKGKLYVDDANSDAAPASTVFALRAGFAQQLGGWRLVELARLDNATNQNYIGSVIVSEANKRYFEPALPRNWLLAVTARYAFD
jgi:iron complex outermembrane receptor protein